MATRRLSDILDGDVPWDVTDWIAEFHDEIDGRDLTPLQVAQRAFEELTRTRRCHVTHIRSGLRYDVDLRTGRVIEVYLLGSEGRTK